MAGLLIVRTAATPAVLEEAALGCDPAARELRGWAREPFDRRRANCALSVLAYVERATGRGPLVWPRVLGWLAWRLVWGRPGRLEAVARRAMAQLGCSMTGAPARGDVGLAELPGSGLTACICSAAAAPGKEPMWAARTAGGVALRPATARLAWRVRSSNRKAIAPPEARCPKR